MLILFILNNWDITLTYRNKKKVEQNSKILVFFFCRVNIKIVVGSLFLSFPSSGNERGGKAERGNYKTCFLTNF